MRVEIARSAETDLLQGFAFYERQQAGVGDYFLDSLFADIDALRALLEIQIFGMKCKARVASPFGLMRGSRSNRNVLQVHEDCEHRATRQFARKMNL